MFSAVYIAEISWVSSLYWRLKTRKGNSSETRGTSLLTAVLFWPSCSTRKFRLPFTSKIMWFVSIEIDMAHHPKPSCVLSSNVEVTPTRKKKTQRLEIGSSKYLIRGHTGLRCISIFYGAWAPHHVNSQKAQLTMTGFSYKMNWNLDSRFFQSIEHWVIWSK